MSLPSRERGLKYHFNDHIVERIPVAPFAGAWIEIFSSALFFLIFYVAPFAGAWIEML